MGIENIMKVAGPVGMGAGLLSGIVGLSSSAAANRRTRREANKYQNFLDAEYLPDMNRRYADTEEAQSFISTLNERLNKQNEKAEQTAAVTGGTDESVLAAKDLNTRAYAEALNRIAGMGTQYKQGLKDRYAQGRANVMQMRVGQNAAASQSGSNVFSNAMNSVGKMAMMPLFSNSSDLDMMPDLTSI